MRRHPQASGWMLACVILAMPGVAVALPFELVVDPARSSIEILASSTATVDLGTGSPQVVPVGPGAGAGGPLPGGGTSSGLRTSLSGTVVADITPTTIGFPRLLGELRIDDSGSWLPGGGGTPEPGQLALSLDAGSLQVTTAMRDAAAVYTAGPVPYANAGSGLFSFVPVGFFALDEAVLSTSMTGAPDFSSPFTGAGVLFGTANTGSIRLLPGGGIEVVVDLQTQLLLNAAQLGSPVPIDVTLDVSATIVASQAVAPEPSGVGLVAVALLATAARSRHAFRRGRPRCA